MDGHDAISSVENSKTGESLSSVTALIDPRSARQTNHEEVPTPLVIEVQSFFFFFFASNSVHLRVHVLLYKSFHYCFPRV